MIFWVPLCFGGVIGFFVGLYLAIWAYDGFPNKAREEK